MKTQFQHLLQCHHETDSRTYKRMNQEYSLLFCVGESG